MKARGLLIAAALTLIAPAPARASKQTLAVFRPVLEGLAGSVDSGEGDTAALLENDLVERLGDRFDAVAAGPDPGPRRREERAARARSLGAAYLLTGTVTRIGRVATIDLSVGPVEEPERTRTVVANAPAERTAESPGGVEAEGLPFFLRRLSIEASARLKLLFFGDETVGEGAARRAIPRLSGTVTRTRSVPGDPAGVARADADLDGRSEVIAADREGIAVFRPDGDDLVRKAVVGDGGEAFVGVGAADLNRNGIAEIVGVRARGGTVVSDVWEFDGKGYARVARDLPYELRTVDLGSEGIVLVGQASGPGTGRAGPIVRLGLSRYGLGEIPEAGAPLPLPEGTGIDAFVPLRAPSGIRYAVAGREGRIALLDASGRRLSETLDTVTGIDRESSVTPPAGREAWSPPLLSGADLDGDGTDELLVVSGLLSAGDFFERIRIQEVLEVLCFAQDGEALRLAWRSPQYEGAPRGAFVERLPGKGAFRIGVAVRERGKMLPGASAWQLLWIR